VSILTLALYCEGTTDERFLSPVIRRTAEQVLAQHGSKQMDTLVLPIELTKDQKKNRNESILYAARNSYGYDALIVHADADDPKYEKALVQRYNPGYSLVQQKREKVCLDLLPIIPVQAIEAWMLADHTSLLMEIGTDVTAHELSIPEKAKQVEDISKPKQKLKTVVQKAYASRTKRKRDVDIDFLYQPLGEKIKLERLHAVPSYARFVEHLIALLKTLKLIQ